MRKLITGTLSLIIGLSLLGCSSSDVSKEQPPGLVGYVVKKESGKILVVSPDPKSIGSTGGTKEYYEAVWFSNAPKKVGVGQKVEVWFTHMETSYPGQSSADRTKVRPDVRPDRATLTEAEALRKALTSNDLEPRKISVIREAAYNPSTDYWEIKIKQDDTIFPIQIKDE